jgi:taurine transport system permease protein
MGATYGQVIRHVILPSALPEILVGMRIAIGFGWTTLVAAEMVAANVGLGRWCSTPATSCAPTS